MAKTKGRPGDKLRGSFNLGGEQAEADPLLRLGFYPSGQYASLASVSDPRCFLIGRTGSGKSAILRQIEEENPEHVIRITPEDLSLPYIADLDVLRYLTSLEVHLDPLFIALWKHVLLIEIIKHRYRVNSPAAKQNFLMILRERISRDKSKAAALDYLEDFEGKFWCETDERVRDITTKFEEQIKAEANGKIGVPPASLSGTGSSSATSSRETRKQEADRYQRIVNETQLARLNKMMSVLDDDILNSQHLFTYIVIDDLDRDWVDEKILNSLIRCLFRTVLDLKRVRNLKVLVALRTNIFTQLNFGSRTGGQEEKFRSNAITVKWSQKDLDNLLSARTHAAAQEHGISGLSKVQEILPSINRTRGHPFRYVLKRTLMRPRDAIAYINECYTLAGGRTRLTWEEIHGAEESYSNNRLLALRDEWKPTFPGIDEVLRMFESAGDVMSRREYARCLEEAALLLVDPEFAGTEWMTKLAEPIWNSSDTEIWEILYHPLTQLLYDIGFIGLQRSNGNSFFHSYDHPDYLSKAANLKSIQKFSVHLAFRSALNISTGSEEDMQEEFSATS